VKFLCEHCKAKYQIADEKVAGRTVRMKCRKCGNSIEVRAAVTETSVNAKVPTEPPPAGSSVHDASGPDAGKIPRPARLATSLSAAPKPAPARPAAPRQDGGTLAGAFHRNVQKEEEISVALDLRELSAAEEWYVAINGVPVGPIRVAELRRKAAIGVVTEESLCWQEGMEEWRPVRAVAELAALVREAAAGGRVSLLTPPPPEARTSIPGPPPRPASTRPAGVPLAPRPARPASGFTPPPAGSPAFGPSGGSGVISSPVTTARSNVVPFTSRLATAEKLREDAARTDQAPAAMVAADPFASPGLAPPFISDEPAPGLGSLGPVPTAHEPVGARLVDFASAGAPISAIPGVPERKQAPFMAIAMIVLAGAFGITAAIIVFSKPAPPVVVQVPQGPAAAAQPQPVAPANPATAPGPNPTETTASAAPPDAGPVKVASAGGSRSGPRANANATDPGIRELLSNMNNGPTPGAGDPSGGGGGAQLNESMVQSVVSQRQAGVKRTCWERSQTQSASVNETVQIVVGAGGQVTSASATGNDPVVGHCIENEVRHWTFPGQGTVNIPFHFIRQ
jgi:predicted Zn finger-like uncharacterized protein